MCGETVPPFSTRKDDLLVSETEFTTDRPPPDTGIQRARP